MKRIIISLVASAMFAVISLVMPLTANVALADTPKNEVCQGVGLAGGPGGCGAGEVQLQNAISVAINLLSSLVGVVAVIMIIIAGQRFITAGGDAGKVASARTALLYAVIGIVIVALAQVIVHFVLHQAASVGA